MNTAVIKDFNSGPIVIGGVGGSGTRVIAELVQAMNVHIGECLNHALDNRWFSMLFRRPDWAVDMPEKEASQTLDIFARASLEGLNFGASSSDLALINRSFSVWQLSKSDPELAVKIKSGFLQSNGIQKTKYTHWGWKEPNSHIYIPQIAERFPNASYILVVRNGLDMAYSPNQIQLRLWGPRFGIELDDPNSIAPAQSLQYWLDANEHARRHLQRFMPGRWLEINYEKLMLNPEDEIDRMVNFVGASREPQILQEMSKLVKPPISVGRFRAHGLEAFRSDQIEAVKALGFAVT